MTEHTCTGKYYEFQSAIKKKISLLPNVQILYNMLFAVVVYKYFRVSFPKVLAKIFSLPQF